MLPKDSTSVSVLTNDDDDRTFHLGAFDDNKLVSIASFYFENHPKMSTENQYRVRGIATLPEYQRQGISSTLLNTALSIAKQNLCNLVWCDVLPESEEFYEKVGFTKHQDKNYMFKKC